MSFDDTKYVTGTFDNKIVISYVGVCDSHISKKETQLCIRVSDI